MTARMSVLGSGSSGNATLLEVDGEGILIDCGFGPRDLGYRLATVGSSWEKIRAVLLTHTHTDHWNRYAFSQCKHYNIPVYVHAGHRRDLANYDCYATLDNARLLRDFTSKPFKYDKSLKITPISVPHDAETFAFRIDYRDPFAAGGWSVGLATDLGMVSDEFLAGFHGVEYLAMEFNHDVMMERRSRRSRDLIERVLGDHGHLSNRQAAQAVELLAPSLKALIPIHLSQECNTPDHVTRAHRTALRKHPEICVHISRQDTPTTPVEIFPRVAARALGSPPVIKRPVKRSLLDFV